MKKNKIEKVFNPNKEKKVRKILIIICACLLIIELIFIPVLILTNITKILPIVCFLLIPVLLSLIILLFGKSTLEDTAKKKALLNK